VAIANTLQLEIARRHASPSPIYAVTLTFDLEHLSVMWWNSVPNLNTIEQSVIAISITYLTLTWTCVMCCTRLYD